MTATKYLNPFHEGELAAQARVGVSGMAERVAGFIRDYLPEQHRDFHTSQPFLVISGADAAGRTWATLVDGPDGFATSPDPRHITLDTVLGTGDPLAEAFDAGTDIGVLGIELATRRRNRFSGHVRPDGNGYMVDIRQSFGNCPQYINERAVTRVETIPGPVQRATALSDDQIALIGAADTMFIGSGHSGAAGAAKGFDASHRGGAPGFVHVASPTRLLIPDYAGNNFFNTIGNLLSDPHIGLLFIDFETGGLLHVTGRATIDWEPKGAHDPDAWRIIEVEIDAVIGRPGAVSLRWAKMDHLTRRLRLAKKVKESSDITSFYFVPADGRSLDPFKAGQHLPIEVQIPGQRGISKRSYSLSGPPQDRHYYRISVKREDKGIVSRFLHDQTREGSIIEARAPSGAFVVPCSNCPLVLVSAGVGLTPMLAALYANVSQNDRDVWYIHGARSGVHHAMRKEADALVAANARLYKQVFYSLPDNQDQLGRDYDAQGRVTAKDLLALGAGSDAQYMVCGPAAFLSDIQKGLIAGGVVASNVHFEIFGPDRQS